MDGAPFFIHSGAFFYDRVSRNDWARVLDRYRELGINTIDIYIPWNWHEPREGEFDFDGRTNPRRDLRGLLRLITEKHFRLIARPGPQILNEWRNGGYPDWLLERPEYHMDLAERLEGRYPPFSALNTHDAEAAARDLLENSTHMAYARKWLAAMAKELAPFSASRDVVISTPSAGSPIIHSYPGPLLFVQLEDDLALGRANRVGPNFWRYLEELRAMLEADGLDAPVFINPTDMRVSAAGSALAHPIGVMGQWYMQPRAAGETGQRHFSAEDASTVELFVEELKTQPAFPPAFIEFQAGWYSPADDDRPLESPPANTLLGSRIALGNGLHGLNYLPLQDTVTPAGYSVPWANRVYRWDAALGPGGNAAPRARAVARNSRLLEQWGEWLAASHKRVDFGLIDPVGSFPQERLAATDIWHATRTLQRIERVAQLATLSPDLIDPENQPVEQLLRYPLVLLPVFDPAESKFELSEKSQAALVEYVRRGGTLVFFPARPCGKILAQLWAGEPAPPSSLLSAIAHRWSFGAGQVIESTKDFFFWVALEKNLSANRAQEESNWSMQVLEEFIGAAGIRPAIKRGHVGAKSGELIATALVSNEGSGPLGARAGGQGLLSVSNLSAEAAADEVLEVLAPGASSSGLGNAYLPLRVSAPPGESLLLPVAQPLCSAASGAAPCHDVVLSAGAELLQVEREGKSLELTFYTPARAELVLRLEKKPSHVTVEDSASEAVWSQELRVLTVTLPRGPAPGFLRVVKISLPYKPHVPEKPRSRGEARDLFEYSIADAVRLPLGEGQSLASDPPLLSLRAGEPGSMLLQVKNLDDDFARDISVKMDGPLRGSGSVHVPHRSTALLSVKLKAAGGREIIPGDLAAEPDGLIPGSLEVRSGEDRVKSPVFFAVLHSGEVSSYQFDFDGDGAKEWVLENSGLRLIVSPESGGRALAFVDRDSGLDLVSSVGALRDNFSYAENSPGIPAERARGRFGLFNRAYRPEWIGDQGKPGLRLTYDAPDIFPAGASIEKTIRLEGPDSMRVNYRVSLQSSNEPEATPQRPPQSFVAVNSVPAVLHDSRTTRFCWATSSTGTSCEDFSPGRAPLAVPFGVRRLEVHSPGRPALALEWDCPGNSTGACGQMTIEMKNFSALLNLQFPPLAAGGAPGQYSIRYLVLPPADSGAE